MKRLRTEEQGASLVEYSLLLALILLVVLLALQFVGSETNSMWTDVANSFP
jgi:Flp pilus assembly pilin Flp